MASFGTWATFGGGTEFGGDSTQSEKYYYALLAMDPPGVFKKDEHTLHDDITRTEAFVLGHVFQSFIDQFERELFPGTADLTIDDWENLLGIIPDPSDSLQTRQLNAKTVWQCALGSSTDHIKRIIADVINPTIAFWDRFDDNDVSFRFNQTTGNGAIGEASALTIDCAGATHCEWDEAEQDHPHIKLKNIARDDTYVIQANVDSFSASTSVYCAGGIAIMNDVENAIGIEIYHSAGSYYCRAWKLNSVVKTTLATSASLTTVPDSLKITKGITNYSFSYIENSADGGDEIELITADIETLSLTDRYFVLYAKNDSGASYPASTIVFCDFIVKYDSKWNNVELIRRDSSLCVNNEREIFYGFVHCDPYDSGEYNLKKAQAILDRIKQAHTFIRIGESDCFRCDDPYSLTERDILGS